MDTMEGRNRKGYQADGFANNPSSMESRSLTMDSSGLHSRPKIDPKSSKGKLLHPPAESATRRGNQDYNIYSGDAVKNAHSNLEPGGNRYVLNLIGAGLLQ